jgi:twitching motility protein PilT
MPRIDAFLAIGREQGCSDIHFTVGLPPLVRIDGDLTPVKYRALTLEETTGLVLEILSDSQKAQYDERGSVDLSYQAAGLGRFRMNVCRHSRGMAAICRVVPDTVPRLSGLGLPPVIGRFTHFNSGLILVTGATGMGKSTTLAAFIDEINQSRALNILTLEDPVEFVHTSKKSQVVQRELGTHVSSFNGGLRAALRQDPDVILVGELRDYETIALALEARRRATWCWASLHTRGAAQTIDRIVDAFPTESQAQVRHTLADNLKCVLSQELVRAADGRGRRAAVEILVVNGAVAQLIRDGKTFQIPGTIMTGRRLGMQQMDQALLAMVRAGDIDPDEAFVKAQDRREFIPYLTDKSLLTLVGPPEGKAA